MNKRSILTLIVSLLFTIMIILTLNIGRISSYDMNEIYNYKYDFKFGYIYIIPIIILTLNIYILLKFILKCISKINIYKSNKTINSKVIYIISFITIFISGFLFLLTYYPGTGMVDTAQILSDPILYSNQYPLIYSLLSAFIFNTAFKITNSSNLSFFILQFLQLIFMSTIISYVIYWFHNKIKSNKLTIITILYFSIFTIFSNLNTAHLRDSIFSAFILLLLTVIYDIINSKGKYLETDKNRFKFMFISMCMIFCRNNSIIILLVLIIVLLFRYRKYYKYFIVLSIFVICLSNLSLFLPKRYHNKGLYQESISIPIQQLCYVIKYKGIDDIDKDYLNNIIYVDTIDEIYNPFMVDKVKWSQMFNSYYLSEHKNEFNKIWIKYLKKYPKDYTVAYLLNTYSLWSINEFSEWESSFVIIDSGYRSLKNEIILPDELYIFLDYIYSHTLIYFNNGSLFWIYIFLMLVIVFKNKKEYLIIIIPFITLWINHMLATPLSSAFRYMSPLGYALPFIIGIVFYKENKEVL